MGHIYLYTGTGAGKTTNALGLALRSIGHKRKVIVIQFLNGGKILANIRFARCWHPTMKFINLAGKDGMD